MFFLTLVLVGIFLFFGVISWKTYLLLYKKLWYEINNTATLFFTWLIHIANTLSCLFPYVNHPPKMIENFCFAVIPVQEYFLVIWAARY